MHSAVEGVNVTALEVSERGVSVTVIVCSAEYNDNVRIGIHLVRTHYKVEIPSRICRCGLTGDSRAADTVIAYLSAAYSAEHRNVVLFGTGCAVSLGYAVAEKVYLFSLKFHVLFLRNIKI